MGLEVIYTEFYHTHENDQFRRIANGLIQFFEDQSWDGILIANPENDDFSWFRADAILFYHKAFVIIDFKDYSGELYIPEDEVDFAEEMWYKESENDCKTLEIKGGSHGNPFRQLKNYRTTFYQLLEQNQVLAHYITNKRIQALNIFTGPLDDTYRVPGKYRYFHITDEENLYNKLVDLNQKAFIKYEKEPVRILKSLFQGEQWSPHNQPQFKETPEPTIHAFSTDFADTLTNFLSSDRANLLILESISTSERDNWVSKALSSVHDHQLPQVQTFVHSSRIKKRVNKRSGLEIDSLYNTLYGGGSGVSAEDEDGTEGEQIDDIQEIVGIKSSDWISDKALIILHESHLVTRSLHQSELLKFGTGRLLEDFLTFLDLEKTNRKLICVGDASSLSYGSEKETIHNDECLDQLGNFNYTRYQSKVYNDTTSLELSKYRLSEAIKQKTFSILNYKWDESLIEVDKQSALAKLKSWFSKALEQEPTRALFVFSNKDAHKVNLWVKRACLSNGQDINTGDLMIVHNNVNIAQDTGLENPTRINNGDYLLIERKIDEKIVLQPINQSKTPIKLAFTKVRVKCISNTGRVQAEVWLLDNYFKNEERLSQEDQIAFKVFISSIIRDAIKKDPFEQSNEYGLMKQNDLYQAFTNEINQLQNAVHSGERVKTKLEEKQKERRKVERKFKKTHQKRIQYQIYLKNPFVNAVACSYGWALTVHKSVGTQFEEIILNANQGETRGVTNEGFFRWLYTGLNGSIERVSILNHQSIHPMMTCHIELDGNSHSTSKSKKQRIDFSDSGLAYTKHGENLIPNANYLVEHIITAHGGTWSFVSIIRMGDYQSRLFLDHIPSKERCSFLISNNGEQLITSVRSENSNELSNRLVEAIYEHESNSGEFQNEHDLNSISNVYDSWTSTGVKKGIDISIKLRKPWYDILEMKRGIESVDVKMTYNSKGFFSKAQLLTQEESSFTEEIISILKDV